MKVPIVLLEEGLEIPGSAFDILSDVKRVAHTEVFGCDAVDLHEAHGAFVRSSEGIEGAFHSDDGLNEQGVNLVKR